MSMRIQTVEDHILARAVVSLCNRMGTRLSSEFEAYSKHLIDTAYQIAQERHTEPVFDGSRFVNGPGLSDAVGRIQDAYDKADAPN